MLAKSNPPTDVFLAYAHRDAGIAAEIARTLRSYELNVFLDQDTLSLGESGEDLVRDAISECDALVCLVSSDPPTSWMLVEFGAAQAWQKPVYFVAAEPTLARLPDPFQKYSIFPRTRVEELARKIKQATDRLSDDETTVLAELYLRTGIPADLLLTQSNQLSKMTKQFNRKTGRCIKADQLMALLLRGRKQGRLPRITKHQKSVHPIS